MKENLRDKHFARDEEVKTAVMKWIKEQSTKFFSFECGTVLLRETVTISEVGI